MLIFKKEKHARKLVLDHLRFVRECVTESRNTLEEYLSGDLDKTIQRSEDVGKLESAADDSLHQIREVLLDGAFLPHIRSDVYRLVEATDSIADEAEDVAQFIVGQTPAIPLDYHADILELYNQSLNCFFELQAAMKAYFKPKGLFDDLREHFSAVCRIESEVDQLQAALTKSVFSSAMPLSEKMHIQRLIRRIGLIADYSEDAADELEFAAMKSIV